jgi:hypothetical protein
MSTRRISWGKGGQWVGLTILPHSCADCLKNLELSGLVKACNGIALPLLSYLILMLLMQPTRSARLKNTFDMLRFVTIFLKIHSEKLILNSGII